ncbi:MAG: hypothetical protein FWF81_12630 [Defluviitaleaceae bacterium]|nr:hypothetical protein [Defluviitaleaceae bacterium]
MSKKRLLVTSFMVALVAIGFTVNVYAETPTRSTSVTQVHEFIEVEPLWANIAFTSINLSFNNSGRATMSSSIIGNPGTTRITANAVLERANPNGTFTHVASFNNLISNSDIWIWERNHYVVRGHSYRLTITATAVRNGVSETISFSSRTEWAN